MIDEAVEEEKGTKVNPIPLSSAYAQDSEQMLPQY